MSVCPFDVPYDGLAPARGILLAVAISVPVWIAIGAAVWAVRS